VKVLRCFPVCSRPAVARRARKLGWGRIFSLTRSSVATLAVSSGLLLAIWMACAMQLAAVERRTREGAELRSTQIVGSYDNDVTTTLNLIDGVMAFVASFAAENGLDRTVSLILRQHLLAQIPGLTANFESALIAAIAAIAAAGSLASTEPAVGRQQG